MSDLAIRVEHLGKMYRIGAKQERYQRFTETMMDTLSAPLRRLRNLGKPTPPEETIWALKDVSFEVKRGEAVGIIGRNGAGKSTLLKILSRITEPTTGRVELHGRVASLLEVGTGFHPELTGRENIYLNGTILGMRKAEIERKFDEIVAFAEIEKFLDTPVKHYSSGMYVRLAFAVAAHLEPEILLVDEVLAVGDAQFQKKCLGKMGDVAREGRTVLFVSHNMGAVSRLCAKCVWLEQGHVMELGESSEIISTYLAQGASVNGKAYFEPGMTDDSALLFRAARILDMEGREVSQVSLLEGCYLELDYEIRGRIRGANVAFSLSNSRGECVFASTDADCNPWIQEHERATGRYRARCQISSEFLRSGTYFIGLSSSIPGVHTLQKIDQAVSFEVVDTGSVANKLGQGREGVIMPVLQWEIVNLS